MIIEVKETGGPDHLGRLTWNGREVPCALGRSGITANKREGDGATPKGLFALRRLLYRPDRLEPPQTGLAASPLTPLDGWCDDPDDDRYNKPVRLPYGASHESLWREDQLYDLIVVLGHNDDPVEAGLGSAIFLHVAGETASGELTVTEGCVALKRDVLLDLLADCNKNDEIAVL